MNFENEDDLAHYIISDEISKNLVNSLNVLEYRLRRSGAYDDALYVERARRLIWAYERLRNGSEETTKS